MVLFDEIEKAHPRCSTSLLRGILIDGRLTDGQGRPVDFRNTVLVMTSNLGSAYVEGRTLGDAAEWADAQRRYWMPCVRTSKPEFLNRVDDVIIFNPLGKEQLTRIVDLRLEDLRRLLSDRHISLELTDAARELVFLEGYDPAYGARPLKRAVQRLIQDPLAMKILDGEVLHGDHLIVDADLATRQVKFRIATRVAKTETSHT